MLVFASAVAVEQIQLSLGTLGSGAWTLQGGSLTIDWSEPGQPALTAQVAALDVGARHIENISFTCHAFDLGVQAVDCPHGQLSLRSDWLNANAVPAALRYDFVSRELAVTAGGLALAGGKLRLQFHQAGGGWQLDADLVDVTLAGMAGLLQKAGVETAGLEYQGRIGGRLTVQGNAGGLTRVSWQLNTREAGYSNAEGTQAAQALVLASRGAASPQGEGWRVQASLAATQGMLYAEPVYLEFSDKQHLDLSVDLRWIPTRGELSVASLVFDQPGVVKGSLAAGLVPAGDKPLRKLDLNIDAARLPGLYSTWLQPWLAGTVLGKLDTEGRLHGRLAVRDARVESLDMQLEDLSARDHDGQFGIGQLEGDVHWGRDTAGVSTLAWKSASVYRLQFGAAKVALATRAEHFELQSPLVVPLFDGELHVDAFELGAAAGQPRWLLDAMLTPVSMRAVSTALGWPPLSGTLSGMIPRVRYAKGDLTLGGVLLVQAFDGDITVRNLDIRQPLGLVPRLRGDVRIDNLDLKTLTEAFSFGRIEGRLDGQVKDLYMEAWKPVAFDAEFKTPPDDDSRHRISQRAVDNISNLGGAGMAGAVSRTFLRFLEDFPYQRLGIRCRLANGVCHMGGVAPAENGYYLVQGRWLPPRLDVIGYASEVDWSSLLDRLKAVTEGAAPQVR